MQTAIPAPDTRVGWVAADSVAVFRILFGIVIAASTLRFLARGWVNDLYLAPANHLTYGGFGWVRPLPPVAMHLLMVVIAVLGVAIAVGYRHRLATGLFVVAFTYTELIEASLYLNHYWFVTLVAAMLWLLPVHHRWSLDARAGRVRASAVVPAVVVWALRAQVGAVYVFAGLAKLNGDWLFRAEPLSTWLADRTDTVLIGPLLAASGVAFVASWAAALFDCTIVGWLLWRRSRPWAYAVLVAFHLGTAMLFQIGVFPWVMMLAALIFFEPDWPSRLLGPERREPAGVSHRPPTVGRARLGALVALALVELWLPLRHYAEPGNVRWNERGYYLSWRVMLTEKHGLVEFEVTDPATGRQWLVGPDLVLEDWQARHAATRPDHIHATALLISKHYTDLGIPDVEVRATAWVAMNGRPAAELVDSELDVAGIERGATPTSWVSTLR